MGEQQEELAPSVRALDTHVAFCFDVLTARLSDAALPTASFPDATCPLFVTWNTHASSHSEPRLRGCIGTLEPKPLRTALRDYALISALQDQRFQPITTEELPSLSCTVSILTQKELARDCYDWVVGIHGIIINFADPVTGQQRAGTFLPEVAYHEGWTQQQAIRHLLRKAGHHKQADAALLASLKTWRYQSTTTSLTHEQWREAQACAAVDSPAGLAVPAPVVVPVPV